MAEFERLFKVEATEEKGERSRMASFVGAIAIADLVKTTLGPKGMGKILQSTARSVALQGGRVVGGSVCKKGDEGGVCLVTKYCSKQGGKEVGKVLGGDVVVRSWWCLDASLV
ncbi:T-complex protein 1 subunit beta [Tanacetum coccineum]